MQGGQRFEDFYGAVYGRLVGQLYLVTGDITTPRTLNGGRAPKPRDPSGDQLAHLERAAPVRKP